jgi:tetratricopeptide (TPR) repeat protein
LDDNDIKAYIIRGNILNDLNDYTEALTDYSKALLIDPSNAIAYNRRGLTYENLKENNKALTDYSKAI